MNLPKNNLSSSSIIKLIKEKKSDFWSSEQKKKSLTLFHKAAKEVPAYKSFLKKNKVNPKEIKTWENLQKTQSINKKNYLRKYPLSNLTFQGHLNQPLVFTATSGSTGDPLYFHRSFDLDWQSSIVHELFYLYGQYKKNEPVLVIVCFGMGIWIGGLITYQAFHLVQERGYNVSLVTPGINKEEIFKLIKNLGKIYKNIILCGYPPFIKDIIDEAPSHKINWRRFNVRLLFAAEAFTESFRDYIAKKAYIKNSLLDTMNIYGTADLGTMAFETPLAVLIRRLCAKNQKLFGLIFNNIQETPTLCQYIPSFISFHTIGENILINGYNSMPLINYDLGDHGGVYSFKEIVYRFNKVGLDLEVEIKKAGISKFCYELPFVYVYERKDLSTKLYGAVIYPEHIREALRQSSIESYLTGKFTLTTKYDMKNNEYMEVNCELKKGQRPSLMLKKIIGNEIVKTLLEKNAEYSNNFKSIPNKVEPHIVLWPNESPIYFKPGTKQKWISLVPQPHG